VQNDGSSQQPHRGVVFAADPLSRPSKYYCCGFAVFPEMHPRCPVPSDCDQGVASGDCRPDNNRAMDSEHASSSSRVPVLQGPCDAVHHVQRKSSWLWAPRQGGRQRVRQPPACPQHAQTAGAQRARSSGAEHASSNVRTAMMAHMAQASSAQHAPSVHASYTQHAH
jgi:hypothetical protein